jgi:hypothetical protein
VDYQAGLPHPGHPFPHDLSEGQDGSQWLGGHHADDGTPCQHGIPDDQANAPEPAGGYTCRATGRPWAPGRDEQGSTP